MTTKPHVRQESHNRDASYFVEIEFVQDNYMIDAVKFLVYKNTKCLFTILKIVNNQIDMYITASMVDVPFQNAK